MKARNWLGLVVATISLWALSSLAAGLASPAWARVDSGIVANVQASIQAAHLAEPLVATTPTSPAEDLALSQALAIYAQRAKPDDASGLDAFLSAYPHSGWAAALQTNLGLSYLHYGYFSRALDAWKAAWANGRNASEPRARALVDRAVGELAQLYASLGHNDELTALFADIGDRAVIGSATEMVQRAREELTQAATDPRHLFICGPLALRSLMVNEGVNSKDVDALQWYRAGPNGTNLAEVGKLADQAEFPHRLVFRQPGQPVPMPAIVHWKVGHFATIVAEANGLFHIEDSVFGGSGLWVTRAALDTEASGYFLVAADTPVNAGWRVVDDAEAGKVWGKGPSVNGRPGDAADPSANPPKLPSPGDPQAPPSNSPPNGCPLCGYNIAESSVSVTLADTPVGYAPPIGPSTKVKISYNQREDSQPANFNFFNVSAKWTLNWLTYVTDDPTNPGANVTRFLSGGGAFHYLGYNSATGQFAAQDTDGSVLTLVSQSPVAYRRQLRDGSVEIYTQSDGATAFPRNIFLSQTIDPQGNSITLTYDGQRRLVSLTDATGRQTTFTYGLPGRPLLVTQITDPFGRSAALGYDAAGRLSSITDILGLTSSFTYDANSLVNSLTTPYGVTSFAYTAPGASGPPRFVDVTDPLGYHEREEWLEPAPIPDSDPAATVPQGMPVPPTNQFLTYRDSFHWDKNAYIVAGCTPSGGCDYSKARSTHFAHMPGTNLKSTTIESVKYPLENRIWYNYPGQTVSGGSLNAGTFNRPIAIGRVLDDGTTQLNQFSYDTNAFKITQAIDPLGRKTQFTYALNQTDLVGVTQTAANGSLVPVAQFTYNDKHRWLTSTDAAGQTTLYTYNSAGQLASFTNSLFQTTTYGYDSFGNLTSIVNPNGVTTASYTYDDYDRVRTYTDSEGWTVTYDYDFADRVTKISYLDGTTDVYAYDKLDLVTYQDRQSRVWSYDHDANRRLTKVTDPLGHSTVYSYNGVDEQTSMTDPKGTITSWNYDVEGRLISKQYADSTATTYGYENTTSRLKSVTDALGRSDDLTI